MTSLVSVQFPLLGEWYVGADGTEPSHEMAFDFMRLDQHLRATSRSAWQELVSEVPNHDYFGWGQPIISPFAGRVVVAEDGWIEVPRSYLRKLIENFRASFSAEARRRLAELEEAQCGDIRELAGNHLVIESFERPQVYAFMAHARKGSLKVKRGDEVSALQVVAEVGDSGQSMMPHLHFHLMSSPNPIARQVIPCNFTAYEALIDGKWIMQKNSKPTRGQRIRAIDGAA